MKLTYLYAPTADLAQAVPHYRDVLGLDEAWRDGTETVAYQLPDSPVQIMVSTTPMPAGPQYLVPDVTAWVAEHAGLPVVVERFDIPGGSVIGLADPDGNAFYVFDQAT